jgi:hypothetical protein
MCLLFAVTLTVSAMIEYHAESDTLKLWSISICSVFAGLFTAILYDALVSIAAQSSTASLDVNLGVFLGFFFNYVITLADYYFVGQNPMVPTQSSSRLPLILVNLLLYILSVTSYFFARQYEQRAKFS